MSSISRQSSSLPERPENGWMEHIEDVYLGRWVNPETGAAGPRAPVDKILISESIDGEEADLARSVGIGDSTAMVADANTWDAAGARIARNLTQNGFKISEIILSGRPHATVEEADALEQRLQNFSSVIAVGSGTVNDLTKYVTAHTKRPYCVFGTAASMDGYASTTASMGLPSGLKISLPAHAPKGVFLDLDVIARAPSRMAAAGFGDCLCNSVARIDWWMSHKLLGSQFRLEPYLISEPDEGMLEAHASGLQAGDITAVGYLVRALVLSGLGVAFTKVSNHGSMGEHQISHYIDCFAHDQHKGTLHGEQVGVATLSMGRIQQWYLDQEKPPEVCPTKVDGEDMVRRMGPEIAAQCEAEYRKKALDEDGAARLNEHLQDIWQELRADCRKLVDPVEAMLAKLTQVGGSTSGKDLGLSSDFYREAVRHAHEMRNRFSFADLACDAGLLDDFAAREV
ncbi:sn-glycerol-1-phosphate dehydrogenase [uncultured Roseibium sp.]|uniref:sn-glycerol-1-phosphate dehydrogenase n=1 Tax=uncultured Roseibium sp. TaxID=1936171 RepID=UPI002618D44C|nr:sn-glycerol-1-phosphate dehydrogenase [uncultured Roseibium sp.]